MQRTFRRFGLAALLASVIATPGIAAGYLDSFSGQWSGGGMVKVDSLPAPVNVSCKVAGSQDARYRFSLAGSCTAMLFMTRDIGAKLRLDPKTGLYRGVYLGAKSGPAKLEGREVDGALQLKVTWGRKVYGDSIATMIIRDEGRGRFSMKVIDQVEGQSVTVSDLSFERGSA